MQWPVFFSGNLEIGNPESSAAICTLWTELKNIRVPREAFSVKGNLYSPNGINYLLRNLLANPKIRYLILCGDDRTGAGDVLLNVFNHGTEKDGKITGSETMLDKNLTKDFVDLVRKNVELIDMRGKENEIEKRIKSIQPKPPYGEPKIIPEFIEKTEFMGIKDATAFRVEDKSIASAWLRILDTIMKFGEDKPSEHGLRQKEILNVMAVVEGDDDRIEEWLPFSREDLDKYYGTFFASSGADGLSYTYGKRLFSYILSGTEKKWSDEARTAIDQINNAVEHLKKAPHTRRAVAFTWYVHEDSVSENPPCLTQITWNLKYGKLFQTAVFRSHDMYGGWPVNAFALRELQKRMAKELSVEPGALTIISNSAHIYENSFRPAGEVLSKYFSGGAVPFGDDKLGYFTIRLEGGEIVAQHHVPSGNITGFTFRGKKAEELYRKILHENLVSRMDHAAYLGKELSRAEKALLAGEKYVQE